MPTDTNTIELMPDEPEAAAPTGAGRDLLDLSEFHGWGQLSPREQKFARAIVAGLSQRNAAIAAGCTGDTAVIDTLASRLAAKAGVRMVIAQALHRAGSDLAETVTKLTRAQAKAFADWEAAITREQRVDAWRTVKEASALLIAIHARASVTVSGQIGHSHVHARAGEVGTIPAEALQVFAELRRSVVQERIQSSTTPAATAA
jgi:hypothetical protein